MRVLGIETSCDETAVGVVDDGRRLVANIVHSQAPVHARYGGVVPELASRQHIASLLPVLDAGLEAAGGWSAIDAVAVTSGPGLAGSLLVGVAAAKALAYARDLPLVGVNHLEAHIYANWIDAEEPRFPLVALVVSGGHTDLVLMEDHGSFRRLGRTRDDAAGEAFDKVARLIGLGFPGGPAIERAAHDVEEREVRLPRPAAPGGPGSFDFSFSGLKTAAVRLVRERPDLPAPRVAAAFQAAVVDVLADRTVAAARRFGARQVLLAGGVAANGPLRAALRERADVPLRAPPPSLCTDNGAMVAACAAFLDRAGVGSGLDLDAVPNLDPFPSSR